MLRLVFVLLGAVRRIQSKNPMSTSELEPLPPDDRPSPRGGTTLTRLVERCTTSSPRGPRKAFSAFAGFAVDADDDLAARRAGLEEPVALHDLGEVEDAHRTRAVDAQCGPVDDLLHRHVGERVAGLSVH